MIKQDFKWQKFLLLNQKRHLGLFNTINDDTFDTGFAKVTDAMQEKYPGKYVLGFKYDIDSGLLYLIPKFEDPKEETFWKLKFSYE